MNHTLEQISFEREHNLRRAVKGRCEKGWRWSWPSNCSRFSEATDHLSGLQSLPLFLLSSLSRCPCTCCSTICQPTKTQRLWIVISVACYLNQCGKLFELCLTWSFHSFLPHLCSFRNRSFLSASFSWCRAMQSSR
jgi:hypothetical protein